MAEPSRLCERGLLRGVDVPSREHHASVYGCAFTLPGRGMHARLGWIPLDTEEAVEDLDEYAPEPEVHVFLHKRCADGLGLCGADVELGGLADMGPVMWS